MKRALTIAAALSVTTFSVAHAENAILKVKFETVGRPVAIATFNTKDNTSIDENGVPGTYTYDEATHTLCDTSGSHGCITMAARLNNAGDTTTYNEADGSTGTATLVETH